MTEKEAFALELKYFRIKNGLTIERAALSINVEPASWGAWERCETDCRTKDAVRAKINRWGD